MIGAGPGGLTAAIYLARYLRDVLVFEDGRSRALWIPRSHNCPGYPEGIPGPDLLDRLRRQAERYGVSLRQERVESLQRSDDGSYILTCGSQTFIDSALSSRRVRRTCKRRFLTSTAQSGAASCATVRPATPTRSGTGG